MTEQNKLLVQRLIEEAFNPGNPDVLDEVAKGEFAVTARRWIGPDGTPSPTSGWRAPTWVADGEKLAAYFRCSVDESGVCRASMQHQGLRARP